MTQDTQRKVVVMRSADEAEEFATGIITSYICEVVASRKMFSLALAGGTTPHGLYQRLARSSDKIEVPWESVDVFFGDERNVPHDHAESNYRMVQRTLLDNIPIAPDRVHPMPADAADLDAASQQYEQTIRRVVSAEAEGGLPRFDLILLGMGADGHTASLFPDSPAVKERDKLIAAHFVPVLGRSRMTFTFPLINAASYVIMLITGFDKADAVEAILGHDESARSRLPAAMVAPANGKLLFVLDAAAAQKTEYRPG